MEELLKLICDFFKKNSESIANSAKETSKAVVEHVSKNSEKYIAGGAAVGAAAVGVASYNAGHTDGKKEGTIEQAKRDETKLKMMHEQHEKDRKEWKEIDKQKDDLIDDFINNINID